MEFINSRLLKNGINGKGQYIIALKVTDADINMLEDLRDCYCVVGRAPKGKECGQQYDASHELKPEYEKFLKETYHAFHTLWKLYDTCNCGKSRSVLIKKFKKNADILDFHPFQHEVDHVCILEARQQYQDRLDQMPRHIPTEAEIEGDRQWRALQRAVPKDIHYAMHFEGNGCTGRIDDVSFYGASYGKPLDIHVKREGSHWLVCRYIHLFGFSVPIHGSQHHTIEEAAIEAVRLCRTIFVK